MKKLLIAALLVVSSTAAMAQKEVGTATISPKIGVNFSTINNDVIYYEGMNGQETMGAEFKIGFTVGAEYQQQLYKRFAASIGLFYSMQGTCFDVSKLNDSEYDISGMKQTFHYINMPIMAVFYLARNFSVKAGVQAGYLFAARMGGTDNIDIFKRIDFSIPIGVAYEYKNVIVDLRYCHGLSRLYKYTDDAGCNRNVSITLGYNFDL